MSLAWADADIEELVVHACSEHFSGTTSLYVAPGQIAALADLLSEFPDSPSDIRTFELGQTELSGYGKINGTLYCRDSSGHLGLHIEVFRAPEDERDRPQSSAVLIRLVPSDLDRFVMALRALAGQTLPTATLASEA